MTTRRRAIQSLTLGLAASGIPSRLTAFGGTPAIGGQASGAPPAIIDTHAHWVGPSVIGLLKKRTSAPRYTTNAKGELISIAADGAPPSRPQAPAWFDVDTRIRHLDEVGIQHQVLSWVGAAYEGVLAPADARPLWRAQNDDLGAIVKARPERFSGLATLPTSNVQWAADELERAHGELGLSGATLPLDAFVSLAGARQLAPIFAVAQKHRSHIFIHRGAAPGIAGSYPEAGPTDAYFGLPYEPGPGRRAASPPGDNPIARTTLVTSAHLATGVITLALTDFLDPYPDVSVQVAMIGGAIPFVAEQIEYAEHAAGVPDSVARLRRVHVDTGQFGRGPRNIALAVQVFGAERVVFGSDYGPQASIAPYVDAVRSAALDAAQREAVLGGNARRILAKIAGRRLESGRHE